MQMDELMQCNPGLRSRFSEILHFSDLSVEHAETLFRLRLQLEYGLELSEPAGIELYSMVQKVCPTVYDL